MSIDLSASFLKLLPLFRVMGNKDGIQWSLIDYDIGTYTKFRIEISLFKGINETGSAIFALDNIKVGLFICIWQGAVISQRVL